MQKKIWITYDLSADLMSSGTKLKLTDIRGSSSSALEIKTALELALESVTRIGKEVHFDKLIDEEGNLAPEVEDEVDGEDLTN